MSCTVERIAFVSHSIGNVKGLKLSPIFFAILNLSRPSHLHAKFYGDRLTELIIIIIGGIKRKGNGKIERSWTYRRLYLVLMSLSGLSSPHEFLLGE